MEKRGQKNSRRNDHTSNEAQTQGMDQAIAGDWNGVMCPDSDRTGNHSSSLPVTETLKTIKAYNLMDSFRQKRPTEGFTFKSATHITESRIDMVFHSADLHRRIKQIRVRETKEEISNLDHKLLEWLWLPTEDTGGGVP